MKTALYTLWALLLATTLACAADMATDYNHKIEKQNMERSLDTIMSRTMYDENVKSKTVNVTGSFITGSVEAQAVYISFRGDECRVVINKELGPLGWPGSSEITRRCRVKPTRATS